MPKRSPLAPASFPDMPAVAGVRLAAAACGLKKSGELDLLLCELAEGSAVAGVFTASSMSSPTVDWDRAALAAGGGRAVVVNSGNANSFTGKAGYAAVERTAEAAAGLMGCDVTDVLVSSTGVIGEPLPVAKIIAALPAMAETFASGWEEAARAISTTDTFPKGAAGETEIGGAKVTLAGIAKGSGMIAPNMATMLGYVFTDAAIAPAALQAMLSAAADKSFNSITVDSDQSTNDTVLLAATGQAGNARIEDADDPAAAGFRAALDALCLDLAHQIVRDGEGATKFVAVTVQGAESDAAAKRVARSIADSPLVKTAIAGEDANWGRIVMAVGKSGEKAEREKLAITIGGVPVARDGLAVDGYDEAPVAAHMKGTDIEIEVDLGVGAGAATVWTCDLTHGYIEINADYRT